MIVSAAPRGLSRLCHCIGRGWLSRLHRLGICHPAIENGQFAGIEYVHNQTALAIEYMKGLRAAAETSLARGI